LRIEYFFENDILWRYWLYGILFFMDIGLKLSWKKIINA